MKPEKIKTNPWVSIFLPRDEHIALGLFFISLSFCLLRTNRPPEIDPCSHGWKSNDCVFWDRKVCFLLKSELSMKMARARKRDPLLTPGRPQTWPPLPRPTLPLPSPLKYLTVFTFSSRVASSSHTNTVRGCCWKADTVHMWLTPSSMALYRANALCAPVMRIITWGSENTPVMEEKEQWNPESRNLSSGPVTTTGCKHCCF